MKKSFSISASFVLPLVLASSIGTQGFTTSSSKVVNSASTSKEATLPSRKLISQATSGVTYYVSGSGDDRNSGLTTASPFRTIQKAANLTKPGDTVLIMNGVYTNSHPQGYVVGITRSGTANAWIKFQAYPGHSPKLKHNGWAGVGINNGASYIEIKGLEIEGNNSNINLDYALSQRTNTSNPLTNGNCITVDGRKARTQHIRILNNKVHNCGGAGISVGYSDYVTIDKNEVFNNAWYSAFGKSGISVWQAWNSDSYTGYKIFVTNNKVYNNRQYVPWAATGKIQDGNGIIIDDFRSTINTGGTPLGVYKGRTFVANNITFNNGGSGIHTFRSEHVDVVHNVAYMNNQSPEISHGQIFSNESSDVKIFNNILYAYPGKKTNMNWKNINVTYAYNIYGNTSARSIAVIGLNDIVEDPQFVNPSIADFRLKSTSPGINSGYKWNNLKIDILGNPRPSGIGYDRGAYEFQE